MSRGAIITGANGGIGRALVAAFEGAGYRVVATDVQAPAASGDDAEASEPRPYAQIDLHRLCEDDDYRSAGVERLRSQLGGASLSVLINNAAVQILGNTADLTAADWRRSLNVNLTAPFLLSQAFLGDLEAAAGSVINIGSIHSRLTKRRFVAYATSKAALEGMTRALAVDLGGRVRINAIAPAAIATDMLEAGFDGRAAQRAELDRAHPVQRIGTPEEVARLAVFVASSEARFLSGAVVGLDGAIGARLHDPD